jgi:phenylalanyl-tRNA synthetase alpha subunit
MDATHLAEFFQVEGVVADYDITLGNLVGMSSSLLPSSPSSLISFSFQRQTADQQHSWKSSLRRWEIRN